ncbi:MAG: hypothetical protein IV104_13150 [Acidovorax sp.]|nr:hypothetical protein [Acidovorax sp.]
MSSIEQSFPAAHIARELGIQLAAEDVPNLVAALHRAYATGLRDGATKEREACADLCDQFAAITAEAQQGPADSLSNVMLRQVSTLGHGGCARVIRARGQKDGV